MPAPVTNPSFDKWAARWAPLWRQAQISAGTGRWAQATRAAATLAVLVATYWLYALLVVPWIEPPAKGPSPHVAAAPAIAPPLDLSARLGHYFPPGSWELKNPKILESDQAILLVQDYENQPDGSVMLRPCTVVFLPDAETAEKPVPNERVVILQSPMAVLQFDQPFDLRQVRVGRLVGGRFEGELQIRGRVSRDGDPDELFVRTHDVQLRNDRILTSQPVEFRLGKNRGRGRDLTIRLQPDDSGKKDGLRYRGIESFQLAREVHLRMELPGRGRSGAPALAGLASATPDGAQPPVEVTCQGLFRFDTTNLTATFEDRVDVVRLNPNGPGDTLAAETLTLQFGRPNEYGPPAESADANRLSRLEIRTISAQGNPVVVRSPQNNSEARCQTLTYDVPAGKLMMQDQNRVILRRDNTEIQVPQLEWTSSGSGGIGLVSALGPGNARMRGNADRPDQVFDLEWTRQLRIEPDGQWQRVLIQGQAVASNGPLARLSSEEIWLWLNQTPAPPQADGTAPEPAGPVSGQIQPDHLVALGAVDIEHPMLSGRTQRLEVWFENPTAKPVARSGLRTPALRVAGQRTLRETAIRQVVHRPLDENQPAEVPAVQPGIVELPPESPQPTQVETPVAAPPERKFDVEGKLIRLRMISSGERPQLSDVSVEGAARFAEIRTAAPEDKPLVAVGDALFVARANLPNTHVKVVGQPGHVEARGLSLDGQVIELDRGQNRLWIDGAGTLKLPLVQDLEGRPLAVPDVLSVDWQGRMDFDGLTFYCDKLVVARSRAQQLHAGVLEVTMDRKIVFGGKLEEQRPAPEQLSCRLGVYAENRSEGPEGLTSIERMNAQEMSLHRGTGQVRIIGPGWLTSVRRGAPQASFGQPPQTPPPPSDDGLSYLHVDYQRQAAGDLHRRELTFTDNVLCTYGPVPTWDATIDPNRPEGLGPRDYQLKCNELTVIDTRGSGLPASERGNFELVATDNTYIDGQKFRAWAHRLTFTQAKDLIVLEGNGRSDARLWHEPRPGAPHTETAARHIQFSPSTQQLQATGIRGLDVRVPQSSARRQ